jgi:nucleotide-binding universal stress UspA family protein
MYRSVLVPLDGSLQSEQALPYAATLARRSGTDLRLAHVQGWNCLPDTISSVLSSGS